MGFRYDYILNQIEKACQLIAALMTSKKVEQKQDAQINQQLAELTGFQLEFFANEKNAASLPSVLNIVADVNARAAAALLLMLKNKERYGVVCLEVLESLDLEALRPDIKALVLQAQA